MMSTTLAIGTEKGAFHLRSSGDGWTTDGPAFAGWKVTAFGTTASGTRLAGLASNWFGSSIHRSTDGVDWEQVAPGPEPRDERKLEQIWAFTTTPAGRVYAGVAEAGLFFSDDDGLAWEPVESLNSYPGSDDWAPGLGGLAAHHVIVDGDRLWVAISAVGVFRSDDGGSSFVRCDEGIDGTADSGDPGYCVHGIAIDPDDSDRMWRQDHSGVYRSSDAGDTWQRIENGLPAGFGFVMRRHHPTGRLFVVPLEADTNRLPVDGHFAVYRSDDDGDSWEVSGVGFPSEPTFTGVLRRAVDVTEDGTVAVGTTGGQVWLSGDAGDSWTMLPHTFPRILTVAIQ